MTKYRTDSLYRNTEVVNSKYLDVLSTRLKISA